MRSPTVSVVIPAYNAAAFIEKTLDSVRAQKYPDYEVIVVDDGSKDGTCDVVQNYFEAKGIRGCSIRQDNKGIAGARNTGMKAARGVFVALLDHDDLWYPEKLEAVMNDLTAHPEADLVCHNELITRGGRPVAATRNGPECKRMYERLLFRGNSLSPSASTFRKEKALAIGGFRENPEFNTVEDYDFWMRLSRVARYRFIDRILGEYQLVERAASRQIEYHHSNLECMLRDHLRGYFGENPGWLGRMRIRKRISAVYCSAVAQLMMYNENPEKQREFVLRMIRTYSLDPKNVAWVLTWIVRGKC